MNTITPVLFNSNPLNTTSIDINTLFKVSTKIINGFPRVNRALYDIISKPPSTIEWE